MVPLEKELVQCRIMLLLKQDRIGARQIGRQQWLLSGFVWLVCLPLCTALAHIYAITLRITPVARTVSVSVSVSPGITSSSSTRHNLFLRSVSRWPGRGGASYCRAGRGSLNPAPPAFAELAKSISTMSKANHLSPFPGFDRLGRTIPLVRISHWIGSHVSRHIGSQFSRCSRRSRRIGSRFSRRIGSQFNRRIGSQFNRRIGSRFSHRIGSRFSHRIGNQIGNRVSRRIGHRIGSRVSRRIGRHQFGTGLGRDNLRWALGHGTTGSGIREGRESARAHRPSLLRCIRETHSFHRRQILRFRWRRWGDLGSIGQR
ncbi:hypothetical protein BC936DRAFT_145478 [Jimgerdemannia flammicorona]|uniref:Uncharacterized protein n=1 Tax=Jimgerdemannia flammicorona TaxID=994334 RepID=A0A433D9X9_9FUNG|nr:hypothetical protein BC936DRAFT_145478 [Jimgerdemannia flammicorona]